MNRIHYILFIICLISNLPVLAQSGSIAGKVKDKSTLETIPGVTVLISENGKLLSSIVSDTTGSYKFSSLSQGIYSLKAEFVGYMAITLDSISVIEGLTVNRDIPLNQMPKMLEGVVVVDYKVPLIDKDKTVSGSTVTAEKISKMSSSNSTKRNSASKKKATSPEVFDIEEKSVANRESERVRAGLLTASELNDFSKWELWKDIQQDDLNYFQDIWGISPLRRYTVQVVSEKNRPVINADVILENSKNQILWKAKTDNTGKAELWAGIFKESVSKNLKISVLYKGSEFNQAHPTIFTKGINVFKIPSECDIPDEIDIAFVVDATGSMIDEISFLKAELLDIIQQIKSQFPEDQIRLGSVFYKCFGNSYVTKVCSFSHKFDKTIDFISNQDASEGGDEVVEEALLVAVDSLKWSDRARARLLFFVLDEQPLKNPEVINKIHKYVLKAAEKGIRIIPVVASAETRFNAPSLEYLMRSIALATNGTYVFLTDHSKIGGTHAKPVTDEYDVELLNNLIQRLIYQYCFALKCGEQIDKEDIEDTTLIFKSLIIAHEIIDSTRRKEVVTPKLYIKDFTQINGDTSRLAEPSGEGSDITNPTSNNSPTLPDNPIIKFYPNPTSGKIIVEINFKVEELYLTDISGKLISKIDAKNKSQIEIDLSNYSTGIYFVKFKENNSWHSGKILLSR
jgi:hypothetical protein